MTKCNTKHSNVIFPLNTNTQTLSPSLPLTEYYEATVEFGKSNVECVDINIVDDDDVEEMEEFKIKLLPNAESVKVADDAEKAVVTIVDNDEEIIFVIGLQEVEYTASEDNATLTVCVELERGGPGPVTGILEYRDITATALEGMRCSVDNTLHVCKTVLIPNTLSLSPSDYSPPSHQHQLVPHTSTECFYCM